MKVWVGEEGVEGEVVELFFIFCVFCCVFDCFCFWFGMADGEEAGWRHPCRGGLSN